MRNGVVGVAAGALLSFSFASSVACAEPFTLVQALAVAYETNPQLEAQRAAVRATDEEVAKAYGAVCTPDFFGYNKDLKLQYRGRLDESRKDAVPNARRDLFEAMKQIAQTGQGPRDQIPSMGCSIKWKGTEG